MQAGVTSEKVKILDLRTQYPFCSEKGLCPQVDGTVTAVPSLLWTMSLHDGAAFLCSRGK